MSEWKETEFGKIPRHWEFDKLENHLIIKGRIGWKNLKVSEYIDNGPFIVGGLQIMELGIAWEECSHITDERYEESPEIMLRNDDILMTKDGTIGKLAFVKNLKWKATVASHIHVIREKSDKVLPIFLFYFFKSPVFKYVVESKITGSVIPALTQFDINNTSFPLPPLPEQTAIASILSTFDDKIDLLHRQNATLEAMAETLFRQWFVEEAKEDWEMGKLGEIAEIQNGFAFSSKDYVEFQNGHLEVLKMGHIQKGGGLRTDPKRDYVPRTERLSKWILKKGDIVMAMTDMKDNVVILGVPAMIDKSYNYVLNQRVARIYLKDKTKLLSNYLLYIQLRDSEFIQVLQSKANSGVQVNLSTETIRDCDIITPPIELQEEKAPVIDNLYHKVEANKVQIKNLTALRETLLPKLMSGEVTVQS